MSLDSVNLEYIMGFHKSREPCFDYLASAKGSAHLALPLIGFKWPAHRNSPTPAPMEPVMSKQKTPSLFISPDALSASENETHLGNAVTKVFGDDAALVAAWGALEARFDGRKEDCRVWAAVFRQLRKGAG